MTTPYSTEPTTGTIPPELVSAILRNPDSPLYPCQIGVYCDDCGATMTADYMVSEDMTSPERLGVARAHLVAHQGWRCDADADLCPKCRRQDEEDGERYPEESSRPA